MSARGLFRVQPVGALRNPKAEIRRPKEGRSPKAEIRTQPFPRHCANTVPKNAVACESYPDDHVRQRLILRLHAGHFGFRASAFFRPSGFGLRVSARVWLLALAVGCFTSHAQTPLSDLVVTVGTTINDHSAQPWSYVLIGS